MDTMRRFAISSVMSTILTVLSWILVLLMAVFYFRFMVKGHIWLD
jgi:hypothetical protein